MPEDLLDRTFVQAPNRLLESPVLDLLAQARREQRTTSMAAEVREDLVLAEPRRRAGCEDCERRRHAPGFTARPASSRLVVVPADMEL